MNENTEWILAVGVENEYRGGARGVSRALITNASNMYPGASLHPKDIPGGEANLSRGGGCSIGIIGKWLDVVE